MQATENDVIGVLIKDHHELEQLFQQIESPSTDADRRETVTQEMITELVRHSIAEEEYLYPAARKQVPGGEQLVTQEIAEHQRAEELMKELEKVDPGDPRFAQAMTELIKDIREHVREEEGELFPLFAQHVDADELRDLGAKVRKAKKLAPTRPHPSAPNTPPGDKVLGPLVGLVDRVRDALSGRGRG